MPRSLIKSRICAGDSLFREVRVKLKNIGVSAPKVLYPLNAELIVTCGLKTRVLTNLLSPDLFHRQCVGLHRIILSTDSPKGALGLSYLV